MSGSLPALQEHAETASEVFCERYVKSAKERTKKRNSFSKSQQVPRATVNEKSASGKFYRSRDHTASPIFKIIRSYFDNFESVYPEKYQERYGYCLLRFCCVRRLRSALVNCIFWRGGDR